MYHRGNVNAHTLFSIKNKQTKRQFYWRAWVKEYSEVDKELSEQWQVRCNLFTNDKFREAKEIVHMPISKNTWNWSTDWSWVTPFFQTENRPDVSLLPCTIHCSQYNNPPGVLKWCYKKVSGTFLQKGPCSHNFCAFLLLTNSCLTPVLF